MKFLVITIATAFIYSCSSAPHLASTETQSRTIASIAALDECYDSPNSSCNNIFAQEAQYSEKIITEALENDIASNNDTDPEQIASMQFNLDKRKKTQGFFSAIKQAKKEYKVYKEKNADSVAQAKVDFKKFKKEIRKNPRFLKDLTADIEKCKSAQNTPESKLCTTTAFQKSFSSLVPKFSQKYNIGVKNRAVASDDSSGGTCSSGGGMNPGTHYHLILLGKSEVSCDTGDRTDRIYGPGAYIGVYNSVYICTSNPKDTTQVGLVAGGAALLGAATSLTFGGAGVCMELAFNFGGGAYAGILVNQW